MDKIKAGIIAVFATLTSWLGILAIPMYILVPLNFVDYLTGCAAAEERGEKVNSKKGLKGIVKKACLWLLVALGGAIDWLIMYATDIVGLQIPFKFVVASVVAVWLICNELISILENMIDIGVDIPPFLMPLVKRIKGMAEEKAAVKEIGGLQNDKGN